MTRLLAFLAFCFFSLSALAQTSTTPDVLVNGNASQQIQLNLNVPDCTAPNALDYTAAAGFSCNATGIATSGTPAAGQAAMWTGATTLQGVATLPSSVLPSIPASLLPGPTASTLGGVESLSCGASSWMSSLAATAGIFSCTQPAWADISGSTLPTGLSAPSFTATATAGSAALTATVVSSTSGGGLVVPNSGYSAAQPVFASQGSSSTGIGFSAADVIDFLTSGVKTGRLDANGHWSLGKSSVPPTVSSCGTPTVTSGSSDNSGEVTLTGSVTGCTITFGTAFSNRPFCTVSARQSGGGLGLALSVLDATHMVIASGTTLAAGSAFSWVCLGT